MKITSVSVCNHSLVCRGLLFNSAVTVPFFNYMTFIERMFELVLHMPYLGLVEDWLGTLPEIFRLQWNFQVAHPFLRFENPCTILYFHDFSNAI
jgi:hypothetical protein